MSELKQLEMQKDDEMEIDLGEIFHLLMNKLWIIVLCFIIGATLAFGGKIDREIHSLIISS